MLAQKTFIKKTRRGNIIKVVREHYLRDDIWSGVGECPGEWPGQGLAKNPTSR